MRDRLSNCAAKVLMALMITCGPLAYAVRPCDSCTEPNGRGIYILERVGYCINYYTSHGNPIVGTRMQYYRFCPEAFVQAFDNSTPPMPYVELTGTLFSGRKVKIESKKSFKVSAVLDGHTKVLITHVSSMDTSPSDMRPRLAFQYKASTVIGTVRGSDVSRLVFQFEEVPDLSLALREDFTDDSQGKRYHHYVGEWKFKGVARPYCPDTHAISLLPGKRVDGYYGKVSNQASAVTLACASGAIAKCMGWGYNPLQLPSLKDQEANALLGACIQAKRAAFFLKFGDTQSYTLDGTPLALDDKYTGLGTPEDRTELLEAIWTEEGAHCLNPQNHRVKPPKTPALSPSAQLPVCSAHDLWEPGILATGRASP